MKIVLYNLNNLASLYKILKNLVTENKLQIQKVLDEIYVPASIHPKENLKPYKSRLFDLVVACMVVVWV